jgi:hypothetical protein
MKQSYKAQYQPEPAKNVDETKPLAPQVGTIPPRARAKPKLHTPDKRVDVEQHSTAPDGTKWGCLVGMDRGE